jgi:hypothetical protein
MQFRSAQVPRPELHGSSGAKTGTIRMTIIVLHILPCNSPSPDSLPSLHYNDERPHQNSTSRRENSCFWEFIGSSRSAATIRRSILAIQDCLIS